jgi:hypothetical protein
MAEQHLPDRTGRDAEQHAGQAAQFFADKQKQDDRQGMEADIFAENLRTDYCTLQLVDDEKQQGDLERSQGEYSSATVTAGVAPMKAPK